MCALARCPAVVAGADGIKRILVRHHQSQPVTGEDRFISKGVNGEWNQTGVGLSRLQFSNAQITVTATGCT